MPHSELYEIKIIPVFVVLVVCTIKIDHIRARAMDQESIIITYSLGGTGGEGSLKRTVHKKIKLERKRKMGGGTKDVFSGH